MLQSLNGTDGRGKSSVVPSPIMSIKSKILSHFSILGLWIRTFYPMSSLWMLGTTFKLEAAMASRSWRDENWQFIESIALSKVISWLTVDGIKWSIRGRRRCQDPNTSSDWLKPSEPIESWIYLTSICKKIRFVGVLSFLLSYFVRTTHMISETVAN